MGSNNKQSRLVELGSIIVFTILDIIDSILCIVYAYLDHFLETDTPSPCYCLQDSDSDSDSDSNPVSKTLYGRNRKPNLFRKLVGFINPNNNNSNKRILHKSNRKNHDFTKCTSCWSDCSCASCVAWIHNDARRLRLHVVVQQPEEKKVIENVIFLHGFMSSSSFWTETIFNHFSDHTKNNYRLFGVDLLGFGKSPKPRDCLYTMEDHLEMIEESIIFPYKLNSFHIVAHSMGSILALALAAKYPDFIKSITLIAPPYFPTCDKEEEEASLFILRKVAPKKLWPPIVFGTSLMSWYEHLGRTVCFFICKYHNIWEFLLKLLTCTRDLDFLIMDSTKHTHHSAWHTMHNIICGSAKKMEEYLEILHKARLKLVVIHGEEDQIVPVECSYNIKIKIPDADIRIIPNTNHITVVLSQIKDFTQQLELIWM